MYLWWRTRGAGDDWFIDYFRKCTIFGQTK